MEILQKDRLGVVTKYDRSHSQMVMSAGERW